MYIDWLVCMLVGMHVSTNYVQMATVILHKVLSTKNVHVIVSATLPSYM